MRYILPIPLLAFLLIASATPSQGANAVEKAFELARELANKVEPANEEIQPAAPQASEQDAASVEQARYPGVEIRQIQRGGNGAPTISIYYPELGNPAIDANLKEFAEDLAASYEENIKDTYEEGEDKPDSAGNWEETAYYTIERPGPDTISILFNIYIYTGGAHGQLIVDARNYDLKSGKRLDLADLFSDPQKALDIMSEISALRLRDSLGDDAEEEMIRDGTQPDANNFSNLSLLPNGVAVEFQPYQVGPWSIGQQRVEISLRELAPAGPSKLVWPENKN